jgi:hypothetical protein
VRINLELNDGTKIPNCNIYKEDVENGDMPFTTQEEIQQALSKVPWGFKHFCYQNELTHGRLHTNDIKEYTFV